MEIIEVKNYQELSILAARFFAHIVAANPKARIILPTGSSPIGMFAEVSKLNQLGKISCKDITIFPTHEYLNIRSEEHSSKYFLETNLFRFCDFNLDNYYQPNRFAPNLDLECKRMDSLLAERMDLVVLGLGTNGHVAFNEPGKVFHKRTHVAKLAFKSRWDIRHIFGNLHESPTEAITIGMGTILKAKEVILLVSDQSKKEAFNLLKELDSKTPEFPSSALREKPHVKVIVTKDAM